MRYEDASGSFSSQGAGAPDARDDADALPAGSRGPATGNTITGEGTITGAAGADIVDNGPGKIVALEGASGSDTAEGGSLHVEGRFGEITMDSRGGYSYTPHAAKPEGGSDVFRYTLADADGARDTATLTIDIGREIEKIEANAQQIVPGPDGVVTLPPGVQLSDILVVGRNLVINLPDGTQMVIIDGAVFVPQLVLGGVEVPASNLAALLIDAEPQPAAGTPMSSGGNFGIPVPPLDPGVPLGDLLPPTELVFEPPIFEDIGQFEDEEPEILIQPDDQPASVAAVDSVNEAGLPARNGNLPNEPAGSGESADGNSSDNDDPSEATAGVILIDSPDDPSEVTINGFVVTGVIGQVIPGAHGTLTITSFSDTEIGYIYTLTDNTSGNTTHDDFLVTVTDNDGDEASATLTINIIDDVPTARNDTDAVTTLLPTTTGNVITSVGTTNSPAGADTVGADNASLTAVSGAGGSDSSFNESGNLVVTGSLGTLTINAAGNYTYVAGPDSPGGTDVFTYTLTDGDGDTSTATLSITVPADLRPTLDVPTAGEAGTVVDEAGLPPRPGEPAGSGESADGLPNNESDDSETTSGTITFTPGDSPATVRIDGVVVTGTVGQTFAGDHGVLTITGYNATTGTINYSYTLTDNTSGDNTEDSFSVSVTDADGDVASGTLVIDIIDDVPTARPDTDSIAAGTFGPATGNVITDAAPGDSDDSDNGADTLGADNAVVTSIDNTANATPAQAVPAVGSVNVIGQYGTLTISANGDYSYTRNEGTPGGVTETFSYTITDGDGDQSTSTLTIDIANLTVRVGENPIVRTDDDAVPGEGGNPDGPGDDVDAENLTGTLSGSGGDGALTFDLLTTGAPAGFSYVDGPGGSILVQQVQHGSTVTVLTITVDAATGAYTVTQNAAILHPTLDGQAGDDTENNVSFTINYTVTDIDGDSAAGTLVIDVDDDTPEIVAQTQLTGVVDEDGLPDGNDGGVNDVPGENVIASGNVSALFSPGADQPLTYSLLTNTSGLPALTSNDVALVYTVSGNTLTATAGEGGPTVFTFTVNATTGAYTFTLVDQLDHPSLDGLPGDDTENPEGTDIEIALGSIIQATDADGDSVTAPARGLVITVDDDSPEEFGEDCPELNAVNTPGESEPVNINLPSVGADQPGTVSFLVEDGTPVTERNGDPVTSNGQPLFYFVNDDGVLEARVGDANGELIFTLTLSEDGTTVTYDQIGVIGEGGGTTFDDLTSTSAGNAEFRGVGADDPATTVDLILSGEAGGADATVNTDSDSIGVANQSMDVGETARIDFVSDLTSGAATPSGFGYTGHVSSNSFIGLIPQVQGSQSETVAFTVWALDTSNTQATEPDRDPAGGFSDSTITSITEVTVTDYLTGNSTTVDVTGFTVGVFTAVAYGISARVNADGSVTFSGIQQGDSYGFSTGAGEFNAVAVQADAAGTGGSTEDSFDLGVFSIGVENVVEPVELAVPIALTDADGDSVVCDIHINLSPPVDAPDVAVTVNEAGLPVIGSDAASDSEIVSGDLQSQVTGGTGPYTFTLVGSGDGTFGTLVLNPDGTFTYTLDTPVDSQPDANDGTNPELGAESFTFEATDSLGATQTGTITVNIIDDIPSVSASTEQPALTVDETVLATDASASFAGVFTPIFGADGPAPANSVTYALGINAGATGLVDGATGQPIVLVLNGGVVEGHVGNAAGALAFTVSVNATGTVTLDQVRVLSHPNAANPDDSVTLANDNLITLTQTITDGDGDQDSATANIGQNLNFEDDGPSAQNDVDVIVGGVGPATGNVLTGVEVAVAEDANNQDGVADNVGADTPGRITFIDHSNPAPGAAVPNGGSVVIAGDFGNLTIFSNGDYSYTRTGGPGGVQDVFTYTLADADGDTTTATLTISIDDNIPQLADPALVRLDDDALAGGNAGGTDDDANSAGLPGQLNGTGGDAPLTYNFTGVVTLPPGFTYNQVDADTAEVLQGATVVLTIQLNQATGAFNVVQNNPIDHPTPGVSEENLVFSIGVEVEDVDGDVEPATITINVDDDTPTVSASTTQPQLTVDETVLATNASADFSGVFTPSFGADGPAAANSITYALGINAGATGLIDVATGQPIVLVNNAGVIEGHVGNAAGAIAFTVSVNATGTVTLDQVRALSHPNAANPDDSVTLASDNLITLTQTITDGDGDQASATANIGQNLNFEDDGPSAAIVTTGQAVSVDESAGVQVDSNDVTGPLAVFAGVANAGVDPDMAPQYAQNPSAIVASTGTTFGADGGTAAFSLNVSAAGVDSGLNTTAGADIFLFKEGDLVVGRVGNAAGPAAFALAINPTTGVISMVEYLSIQHPNPANPDESVSIANGAVLAVVTATDGDGDTSTASTPIGSLISFQDAAPIMTAASDINIQNSGDVAHTGQFAFLLGADGAAASNDVITNVTGSATVAGNPVTNYSLVAGAENATTATYTFSFDYSTGTGTATATGTLTFNKAAGTYTVDLDNPIQGFSILQTATGTLFQGYEFGTSTPDGSQPEISVTQIQGTPGSPQPSDMFIQFTSVTEPSSGTGDDNLEVTAWVPGADNPPPVDGGGDTSWSAGQLFNQDDGWVSTSNTANGVDGDTIQGGEVLDFTLVQGANPTGVLAQPATFAQATSMFLKFDGIGTGEDFIVILKLYDPVANTYTTKALMVQNADIQKGPGSGPGVFSGITLDNNDGLIVIEPNDYQEGNTNLVIVGAQIAGSDEGVTGTAINFNNATGAGGASTGTQAFSTDGNDGPMKISSIGILSQSTTAQNAELTFNVTVTDGDGDSITQTVVADVTAAADSSTPISLPPGNTTVSQAPLDDKSSLMSSDSFDNHRTMSAANNNSVLLGAIAAAGLGVSSAAAAQGFGSGGNHMMLDTVSFDHGAAAVPGFTVNNREMARDGLSGETREILRGEDNAGASSSQRAIVDKLSLTDAGGDQGQAPTALLQATEMQHSDLAQSTLTTAAVGMPSAEMLAGGNSNDNAVDGQAHGTAEVGRVLLDALAGGGRGPDLDAVIDAVANQGHGGGAAALEALASPGAGDVSAWHMAGFSGFPGSHASIIVEPMLHHDAVAAT